MSAPGLDRHGKPKQRGAVLMIMVAILVVAFAAFLVGSLSLSTLNSARQEKNAAALAQAKEALIGYAVSDPNRPGELPCPDINDDGMITLADYSGSNCQSLVGRLPWKLLGLPDLRDSSGEHLWYALTDVFHANSSAVLNSNTKGALLVYDTNGTTQLTQAEYSAVAVIFSPGSPVGSQTRNTVAQQNSAANYLDAANGRNNATSVGPFIAGAKSDTFNDQLLYITTKDLMPLVEQRVAGEVKKALELYYTNSSGTPSNRYYPWADSLSVGGGIPDFDANDGETRGWLPFHSSDAGSLEWYVPSSPPLWSPPPWFFDNQWYTLIYYSVAPKYSRPRSSSNTLTVDSTNNVRVLFFMPGTYNGTRNTADPILLTQYLENSANNDDGDDSYVTPTSTDSDRDRIYWLSSTSNWNQ